MDQWITLRYALHQSSVRASKRSSVDIPLGPKNDASQKRTQIKLMASLNDLAARGIKVSGLILDDVWQTVDDHDPSRYHAGLLDFEADPVVFKLGFEACYC